MQKYSCHKVVEAFKIFMVSVNDQGLALLCPEDEDTVCNVIASDEYMLKNKPEVGGYYVKYEDGYESYSPAEPFEKGYSLITDHRPPNDLVNVYPLLKYFKYDHLPEHLQAHSKPFCDLAIKVARSTERNAETTVALRKLLEAKDAAVRATL